MPASSPAPPTAAHQGWQAVDAMLEGLDRLAAGDISSEQFYAAAGERLAGLGFSGLAVWVEAAPGEMQLAWHGAAAHAGNGQSFDAAGHRPAVRAVVESGQARSVPSPSANGNQGAPNATLVAPWKAPSGQRGALQAWLTEAAQTSGAPGYLPLLDAVGEIVAGHQARAAARQLQSRVDRQSRREAFAERVHSSLDLTQTAYTIANDGRALVGCDRLSVALRRGSSYPILAVSGAEHIHRHSPSDAQLRRLCRAVAATGEPLWQDATTGDLPPQVSEALAAYVDASPAIALAVIPLVEPATEKQPQPQPVGVLVCEQYNQPFEPAARESIEGMLGHCRQALASAAAVSAIPGHRLWLALGGRGLARRWGLRTLLAVAIVAAIVATLFLVPADIRIRARGELQPAVRQEVFAPRDGVVTAVHVDHGQLVEAGEPLLELRSSELELELQQVQGELETTRKRLAAAQSERLQIRPGDVDARLRERRLTAEEEQHQQQIAALAERQKMLRSQLDALTVKSPLAGQIVTWNAQQRLAARPLRRGDALLTVADVGGDWQVELRVPSRQAGRLLAARRQESGGRDASLALTTAPGQPLAGEITHVSSRAQIDEAGESYVLVTVAVPREQIAHRVPGATAVGRISCGRGTLAEAWFHDLADAVRLWLPF